MAAFERFRSLCGGSKADSTVTVGNGMGKAAKKLSKKLQKRKAIQMKKSNKRNQKFSLDNFRLQQEKKLVNSLPKMDSFGGMLNEAIKVSQENKIAENKSIKTGQKLEKKMNKLNKYGLEGWMLDRD